MSSYLELQQRVAGYLNRTTFTAEVKQEIKAAIRFYERRRLRFNETSTALATVANQTFILLPANFLILDRLEVIQQTNQDFQLERRDFNYIRDMNAASAVGVPTDFTLYKDRIELAVIPDTIYSVPCYYLKSLTELSADADTNEWTTGAWQDVIVARATKIMQADILRNDKEEAKFSRREDEYLKNISSEQQQFQSGSIKPTRF